MVLSKLIGCEVEFDLENRRIKYTDKEGKRQKENLEYGWRILDTGFYMSFSIWDDEGHANLLEQAIVEELLKERT